MYALQSKSKAKAKSVSSSVQHKRADKHTVSKSHSNATSSIQSSCYTSPPVQRLYAVQSKLAIGEANDVYELEADRVADRVVEGEEAPKISRLSPGSLDDNGTKQSQTEERTENAQSKLTQRKVVNIGPVQKLRLNRQEAENDNIEQTQSLQQEDNEQTVQSKEGSPFRTDESDEQLESQLKNSKSAGDVIAEKDRGPLEQAFGADFSGVRIHTDSNAVQMSKMLHAHAFTHGQHIYFNQGKYDPDSKQGKHLLAHELTHTVQQGGAQSSKDQDEDENINASFVQGGYLANKLNKYAKRIPGWDLLTTIIGRNPITRKKISRNAENFLGGVIGMIPFGADVYKQVKKYKIVNSAFTWFKKAFKKHNFTVSYFIQLMKDAWDEMSIRYSFSTNYNILKKYFYKLWNAVKKFAKAVGNKVISLLKAAFVTPLVGFIKERTTAYPLFTVIIGYDPITGKGVDRSLYNIVSGFLLLTNSGKKYLQKLNESGTLIKLTSWMDAQVAKLDLGPKTIKKVFSKAWDAISIKSVIEPVKTFKKLYDIFSAPVKRVFNFVVSVAKKVLNTIKDWLLAKLKAHAHKMYGYPLLTVILKKDLITGERVPRTAKNFIRGFMSLAGSAGLKKYKDLEKSGAIDRALVWLKKAVRKLNLSWNMIKGLFSKAWKSLKIGDLMNPIPAFKRMVAIFKPPVVRIFNFVGAVVLKVAEFIFIGVMGPTGERVLSILKKAKHTFIKIIKDPIGFASNLLAAVGKGFKQFSGNIWKHLKAGLVGWLLGSLKGAGLVLPETLNLKGIISLALQVTGITYARIRVKLVKHLGEGLVSKLEKVFEFVKILVTEGPAGIWKKIIEYVGNLKDTVLGAIKDWIVTKIVTAAVTKIASMLNPVGAVIQAIIAVYNTIMFFIERIHQILDLVEAVVNSIASIVAGKIDAAANFVEQAMARTIPVIISFLARLIGLGGISAKIMNVIKKIQEKVDMAIDKVVGFIVKKARKLFGKVKTAAGKLVSWWTIKKPFKSKAGKSHTVYFKGKGKSASLVMSSKVEKDVKEIIKTVKKGKPTKEQLTALSGAEKVLKEIDSLKRKPKPESQAMQNRISAIAGYLALAGVDIAADDVPDKVNVEDKSGKVLVKDFAFKNLKGELNKSLYGGAKYEISQVSYIGTKSKKKEVSKELVDNHSIEYTISKAHDLGEPSPKTSIAITNKVENDKKESYERLRKSFPVKRFEWMNESSKSMSKFNKLKNAGLVEIKGDVFKGGESKWRFVFNVMVKNKDLKESEIKKLNKLISANGYRKSDIEEYFNMLDDDRKTKIGELWMERWGKSTHVHHITPLDYGGVNETFVPLKAEVHVGSKGVHPKFWEPLKKSLASIRANSLKNKTASAK